MKQNSREGVKAEREETDTVTVPELVTWPVVPLRDHVFSLFFCSSVLSQHNKWELCLSGFYNHSGKMTCCRSHRFMFNLVSLRRVKNRCWSSSYFEGTWKRSCSPTLSAVNGADISRAYWSILQAAVLSVKSGKARTCFMMNQAQQTELTSWINFHFYSVYLDCLHLNS